MDISFTKHVLNPDIYHISTGIHRGKNVLWVKFPYSLQNKKVLKETVNAFWSRTQMSWYIHDVKANRHKLGVETDVVGKEIFAKIAPVNLPHFENFQKILKLKSYSQNTVRTYSIEFATFLSAIKNHDAGEISSEKLQSYFLYCHNELQLSDNYIHSRLNSVKFFYEKVLHRSKMFLDIPRPKKPLLLPKALNAREIKKIINSTENIKHRLIIKLCYGMGLRVSEIVALKVEDIDSSAMKVLIAQAKGKKDRYVNLPDSILSELREYYKIYRPKKYLFEGSGSEQYSKRSAQSVFKTAMKKAGIYKNVGIHSLRHSYATHLLEYGTDISHIQKLMGHNNIKTTLNYTKVTDKNLSKIKSPLDSL